MNKEEFIKKAVAIHGSKYDYSKVEYKNTTTKVCIICPIHGEFYQTPKSHLMGYGCSKCGREKCGDKLRKSNSDFLKKIKEIYGDVYDYSKVDYKSAHEKVIVTCKEHGDFLCEPNELLRGHGCPVCAHERTGISRRIKIDEFIKRANEVHNGFYDYSETDINSRNNGKIKIKCPIHGIFYQDMFGHLSGQGCPQCAGRKIAEKHSLKKEDFVSRANDIHNGFYSYKKVDLGNRKNGKVLITCPIHGDFWTNPLWHLKGHGCPQCGRERTIMGRKSNTDIFIEKAREIHCGRYTYDKVVYEKSKEPVIITCPEHGDFLQTPEKHLAGHGCPKCGVIESKSETEIFDFCCELLGKERVVKHERELISPYEIDIFIPDLKIGIEYNGLRWHSEKFKNEKWYHLNKTELCAEKGVALIQIFEDEYLWHKDIVLSKIRHLLKKEKLPKVMGRKCVVGEINRKEAKKFMLKNHIQGFGSGSVHLGAFYGETLIGVMSFKKEQQRGYWELTRYSSSIDYICAGVGGKLFKYFVKHYKPVEIKSFADRRWTLNTENNLYINLGFLEDKILPPDYRYFKNTDGMVRQHKFSFRKSRLAKRYGISSELTEKEMANNLGYERIWDCGLIKYVWRC